MLNAVPGMGRVSGADEDNGNGMENLGKLTGLAQRPEC